MVYFNVMTSNVRGLRNPVKWSSIFCFLKIVKIIFCKKRTQSSAIKLFGGVNGEVSFSFHMDPHKVKAVKVSAF